MKEKKIICNTFHLALLISHFVQHVFQVLPQSQSEINTNNNGDVEGIMDYDKWVN